MKNLSSLSIAAALALAAGGAVQAAAPAHDDCFYSTEWAGWHSPDSKTLYLRVNVKDIYRVDLASSSPELQWGSSHLISRVRGSNLVCSALDLDLAVSDGHGMSQPLLAKSLTRLTPEQVAAIPKKDLP